MVRNSAHAASQAESMPTAARLTSRQCAERCVQSQLKHGPSSLFSKIGCPRISATAAHQETGCERSHGGRGSRNAFQMEKTCRASIRMTCEKGEGRHENIAYYETGLAHFQSWHESKDWRASLNARLT